MFPDPFKEINEKLDKKFNELIKHIDLLIDEIKKLREGLDRASAKNQPT